MGLFLCTIMAVLSLGGGILLFSGIGYLHTDKHSAATYYILIGFGLLMLGFGFPLLFMVNWL